MELFLTALKGSDQIVHMGVLIRGLGVRMCRVEFFFEEQLMMCAPYLSALVALSINLYIAVWGLCLIQVGRLGSGFF